MKCLFLSLPPSHRLGVANSNDGEGSGVLAGRRRRKMMARKRRRKRRGVKFAW